MNKEEIVLLAEDIRIKTESLPLKYQKISISIGIVTTENLASYNVDKLLEGADHALYTAKKSGRNRVVYMDVEDFISK